MENYEKKYKEALERAREFVCKDNVEVAEYIFPELKESDEWIRKALIGFLKEEEAKADITSKRSETLCKYIAWLEKQGEQKPYGQREECFDCQFNYVGECKGSCAMKRGEQEPAWSEEDENHVDSLLKRLKGLCRNEFATTRFAISEDEDWLKSLRPQNTWKPSDKQMNNK